jgi:cobalt/nickel transport system permease protein
LADWATYITTSFELASALHGSKPIFSLFWTILLAFVPTQLPLGILEGFLTGGMIVFVYKRRPDILSSLGVVKEAGKCIIKNGAKIIAVQLILLFLSANSCFLFAGESTKWNGVDKAVVEKVAREQGRAAWTPLINTGQGDLLLFMFLLAGVAGGFVLGYNSRKLFGEKK